MVVVKIELWPFGDESKKRLIGECHIANDGTGTPEKGNYWVRLFHAGTFRDTKKGFYKKGRIEDHNRKLSPYHLLLKCLESCLKGTK